MNRRADMGVANIAGIKIEQATGADDAFRNNKY